MRARGWQLTEKWAFQSVLKCLNFWGVRSHHAGHCPGIVNLHTWSIGNCKHGTGHWSLQISSSRKICYFSLFSRKGAERKQLPCYVRKPHFIQSMYKKYILVSIKSFFPPAMGSGQHTWQTTSFIENSTEAGILLEHTWHVQQPCDSEWAAHHSHHQWHSHHITGIHLEPCATMISEVSGTPIMMWIW